MTISPVKVQSKFESTKVINHNLQIIEQLSQSGVPNRFDRFGLWFWYNKSMVSKLLV